MSAPGGTAGAAEPPVTSVDASSPPVLAAEQIHESNSASANGNGNGTQLTNGDQDQDQQKSTKQETSPASKTPIALRLPHKYTTTTSNSSSSSSPSTSSTTPPPPLEWLQRTWTVTHSTLPMWRSAKNVRITYKIIEPASEGGQRCLDDTVTSVPTKRTLLPQPRSIRGVDTPVVGEGGEDAGWNWRGRGWLKITSSHWEVLGWGERLTERDGDGDNVREEGIREKEKEKEKERWVVTWFAPSLFTPAGIDVYSDNKGGISEGLFRDVERALEGLEGGGDLAGLCKREMREILIDDGEVGK